MCSRQEVVETQTCRWKRSSFAFDAVIFRRDEAIRRGSTKNGAAIPRERYAGLGLERQPQCELDLAGSAERAGGGADRCCRRAAHGARDLAEAGAAHAMHRIREVRVIE